MHKTGRQDHRRLRGLYPGQLVDGQLGQLLGRRRLRLLRQHRPRHANTHRLLLVFMRLHRRPAVSGETLFKTGYQDRRQLLGLHPGQLVDGLLGQLLSPFIVRLHRQHCLRHKNTHHQLLVVLRLQRYQAVRGGILLGERHQAQRQLVDRLLGQLLGQRIVRLHRQQRHRHQDALGLLLVFLRLHRHPAVLVNRLFGQRQQAQGQLVHGQLGQLLGRRARLRADHVRHKNAKRQLLVVLRLYRLPAGFVAILLPHRANVYSSYLLLLIRSLARQLRGMLQSVNLHTNTKRYEKPRRLHRFLREHK